MFHLLCLAAAVSLLGFVDTHTDEVPVVLAGLLLASMLVTGAWSERLLVTAAVTGTTIFVTETLVHLSLLRAPYGTGPGLPLAALFAMVPALLGSAAGKALRWMAVRTV